MTHELAPTTSADLTLARSLDRGCPLTKAYTAGEDGRPVPLETTHPAVYEFARLRVADLGDLAAMLRKLVERSDVALLRDNLPDGVDKVDAAPRNQEQFAGTPTSIIAIDVDEYAVPEDVADDPRASAVWIRDNALPEGFRGRAAVVQLTPSYGLKPGPRLRLLAWADRPVSNAQLSTWLVGTAADTSLYRDAQLHYAAAPLLDGLEQPVPTAERVFELEGEALVAVPRDLPAPPASHAAARGAVAVEPDREDAILLVRRFLAERLHNEPSGEDEHRYKLACEVRDFGLSEPTALVAMSAWNEGCDYPREAALIEKAVHNAYRHAQNEPGSKLAQRDEAMGSLAPLVEDDEPEPAPKGTMETLKAQLIINPRTKAVTPIMANVKAFILHHPEWAGVFSYDLLARQPLVSRRPPDAPTAVHDQYPRPLNDGDLLHAQWWFQTHGFASIGKEPVVSGVSAAARENSFDPLHDHLRALKWDGVDRIGTWLTDYCRAKRSEYNDAVGAMILIGLVARGLNPGCKFDYAPIFEGSQGTGKSTMCHIIAGSDCWISDDLPDLNRNYRDAQQHVASLWMNELGELKALRKTEVQTLRSFLTVHIDKFRAPYDRCETVAPRRCCFWGTTNETEYLGDLTGNRRFWPIHLGDRPIDLAGLARDRDQLLAEAIVRYEAGEAYVPSREFERRHMVAEQQGREITDPWEPYVREYLKTHTGGEVTTNEILAGALMKPRESLTHAHATRVGSLITACGWQRRRKSEGMVYTRPEPMPDGSS